MQDMTTEAYAIEGANRPGPWLVTCDHASNAVPGWVNGGDLALPKADMARHIAYDPGAAGVARQLAKQLDAPCVLSKFSRLVIDPNRGEDDPTLITELYDGSIIEANRRLSDADRNARIERLYRPYHDAIDRAAAGKPKGFVYVAVHSFTPQLKGRAQRPWQVGILFAEDKRFSGPLIEKLRLDPDLCVGENEPYDGALRGDAVERHALAFGRHNTLIELRNDLIAEEVDQIGWAERLAITLEEVRRSLPV